MSEESKICTPIFGGKKIQFSNLSNEKQPDNIDQKKNDKSNEKFYYESSKIFWKERITLDLFMKKYDAEQCLELFAFCTTTGLESNHLYFDFIKIKSQVNPVHVQEHLEHVKEQKLRSRKSFYVGKESEEYIKQFIINYILSRLEISVLTNEILEICLKNSFYDQILDFTQTIDVSMEKPKSIGPSTLSRKKSLPIAEMKAAVQALHEEDLSHPNPSSSSSPSADKESELIFRPKRREKPVFGAILRRSIDDNHVMENTNGIKVHQNFASRIQEALDEVRKATEREEQLAEEKRRLEEEAKQKELELLAAEEAKKTRRKSKNQNSPTNYHYQRPVVNTNNSSHLPELDKFLKKTHANHLPGLKLAAELPVSPKTSFSAATTPTNSRRKDSRIHQDLHELSLPSTPKTPKTPVMTPITPKSRPSSAAVPSSKVFSLAEAMLSPPVNIAGAEGIPSSPMRIKNSNNKRNDVENIADSLHRHLATNRTEYFPHYLPHPHPAHLQHPEQLTTSFAITTTDH